MPEQTIPKETAALFVQQEIIEVIRAEASEFIDSIPKPENGTALTITTPARYTQAVENVRRGKQILDVVESRFRPGINLAHQLHKWILGMMNEITQPMKQLIAAEDAAAIAYDTEQERQRLVEEAQRREVERQRVAREEEERQKKIREIQAEELKRAEEAQLGEADRYNQLGMPDVAEEIMSQPILVDDSAVTQVAPVAAPAPVVVPRSTPVIFGRSHTKKVDFEIINPELVPREFCEPSEKKVRAQVTIHGMATKIPGVRVFEKVTSSTRR